MTFWAGYPEGVSDSNSKPLSPAGIVNAVVWVLGLGGAGVASYFSLRAAGVVGELPRADGGSFLVNTLTLTSTKEDFVRAVMSAAESARAGLSQQTKLLIAAWAALESGWGKSRQAKLANNIFNVSKGSWAGPTIPGNDTEFREGQTEAVKITQEWRQYATLTAAVADVLQLISTSRYVNYREASADLLAGNATFATRLGVLDKDPATGKTIRVDTRADTAGYYTHPRSDYQAKVNLLLREVTLIAANASLKGLTC